MKKQISILAAALAMTASVAYADTFTIAPGTTVKVISTAVAGTTPATGQGGCVVLNSAVTVGTSTNVNGAYDCRAATATTPAAIGVGSCHTNGLIKLKTFQCATGQTTNGCSTTVTTYEAQGASAFMAVSTGGSVTASPLGAACDATGIQTAVTAATSAGIALAAQ